MIYRRPFFEVKKKRAQHSAEEQTAVTQRLVGLNRGFLMKKFALGALVALATTSALAQATTDHDEYYVVHNPESNECTVEEKKPADTTIIVDVFKTRTDAEDASKIMEVCKPDLDDD